MSIKVALEHQTTYEFARPVTVNPHLVRLRPAPHSRTPIEAYSLEVSPREHFVNWQQDPFGNWAARLVFPEKVSRLSLTVGLVADMMVINPLDFFIEAYAERFPFEYEPALKADLAPYLRRVADSDLAADWKARRPNLPAGGVPTVSFLADLNTAVYRDIAYDVRMEHGVQTPDQTLNRRIGSCRDSAWLLVSLLRQHGLAARFVSGYLVQLAPDRPSLDGPSGTAVDFTDLHAWTEVFIPGAGWIGLDPTSALFAGEGHIPLSATPHPSSAAPITGTTEPTLVTFGFRNEVRRIHEDPRTTKPYTAQQWSRIDALGGAIDERLNTLELPLTFGGEPTFVALDDATSRQWNTAADGPEKRELASALAERLRAHYAGGGVMHRGQGKWYPGEPLPRWNISLQWRTDGVPLWQHPELFADPWDTAADPGAVDGAEQLARRVTAILGLPVGQLVPAYEDPLAELAAEVRKPEGPRPEEAANAAAVAELDGAETTPAGWVLPLTTDGDWTSPAWRFRRGRLVLAPGTSAIGFRLPLDSISWEDPEWPGEPSYFEAGPPLHPGVPNVTVVSPDGAPPTALTIEERDGHVFVFLPPTQELEGYADLLHVIELAAVDTGQKLVLEGYGPPPDARLTQLSVTPDPGVIEVNVQPTSSWAEQRDLTFALYEHARAIRLTTEKFDLDGTHQGTGGGNHLTLGGRQPVESPLLRRPELLASFVTYWQRHPSLSYLFSGRFIGPTSQAPRFDEGRPEAVYEMEIALEEVRRLTAAAEGGSLLPWVVDRSFRHLLTDLTGNTHRAEFCIDKLYSPDGSRGRLGLLELRGFEMPPHPELALVQALLVRSLVAMFAERPVVAPLVRWGTRLHDDFLLPAGTIRDIAEVVADLRAHGIPFEETWLDAFSEFRFPRIGMTEITTPSGALIELELRAAIEPWNVLGEEARTGGTARYVDSSVERVQVAVRGLDPHKHLVTCNQVPVPLTSTGRHGEYYAGVRYRAWQPHSALHPTIPIHAPLTFDVIDAEAGASLGGATYHVVHPGGRTYERPPVNANEAEARRASRFERHGHTPGRVDVAALREAARRAENPDYPHTLDLRRVPTT